jgi:hypothetical protein
VDGLQKADSLVAEMQTRFSHFNHFSFVAASARNSGGDVFVN